MYLSRDKLLLSGIHSIQYMYILTIAYLSRDKLLLSAIHNMQYILNKNGNELTFGLWWIFAY